MSTVNGAGRAVNDDEFTLMLIGIAAWPLLAGVAAWAWSQGASWLVKHHILLAAKADPWLAVPGMAGAGLDLGRLVIVIGLVLVAAAITVGGIHREITVRRQRGEV